MDTLTTQPSYSPLGSTSPGGQAIQLNMRALPPTVRISMCDSCGSFQQKFAQSIRDSDASGRARGRHRGRVQFGRMWWQFAKDMSKIWKIFSGNCSAPILPPGDRRHDGGAVVQMLSPAVAVRERKDRQCSSEYLLNLHGVPIGPYEEATALFAGSAARPRTSIRQKENHEPATAHRRSKRRSVNAKEMGSNVSRHSGKGLSGRRAQSSGSLCKILAPRVGRVLNPCGEGARRRDRNKLTGSLPNRLDDRSRVSTPETLSNGNDGRPVELLLHKLLQHEPGCRDQGYDSEKSPGDESPARLSVGPTFWEHSVIQRANQISFITQENTFEARLEKGSRGLGLSVTGGIDTGEIYPGLIRIKRIFPHQPAWEHGALQTGDIILEANGAPLTGLTNHEALELLRTIPSKVVLKVCRPPGEMFSALLSIGGGPPTPPKRDSHQHIPLSSQSSNASSTLPMLSAEQYGEFEVTLKKVNGSLGFTLRKEDESVLGHYIKALVREPALSDGRIRSGDKIVSVNDVEISPFTHEEAVMFLRKCGDQVRLRLYRDLAQTPVSALSPTESHKTIRPKPALRKEAMDMLCDLAVKKSNPSDSTGSSTKTRFRISSPGASPRRRRLTKTEPLDEPHPAAADDSEPSSMPPLPTTPSEFSHRNPLYQSSQPAIHGDPSGDRLSDQNIPDTVFRDRGGSQGLLKWKGVVFTPENEVEERRAKGEVLTVELVRGWNSRLGFSLQSSESGTLISAIYPDSVAAKDGRLRSGDEVIMINDEPTRHMTTSDVIDLLRRVRGSIAITVVRNPDRRSS